MRKGTPNGKHEFVFALDAVHQFLGTARWGGERIWNILRTENTVVWREGKEISTFKGAK